MRHGTNALGVTFTIGLLATAALFLAGAAPAPHKPAATGKAALIARGLYLTTVMSCNDCHTPGALYGAPDFTRKLAGSEMGWKGPWGISFARNLTPDTDTGIGYWSEQELINTLRTGVKPDGKTLLPPMPWPNLAGLTDADAKAIAAYLMSLPPVKHKVPDTVPPGQAYSGPTIDFPPPSAWDAPPPAGNK